MATGYLLTAIKLVEKDHLEYDWVYANLSSLLFEEGDFEKAFAAASKAADRNPCSARNFHFGGKALAKLSKNDLCVDWLKRSVAISCLNGPAVILRNEGGTGNHWLVVNTIGTVSNRDGIGAWIRVVGESGFEQYGIVSTAGSYQSASDKRVHFGLGPDKAAKLVEILWPSGIVQQLENVRAGQILDVKEPPGTAKKPRPARPA
jgi:tetratricopeptide (TPR) repeat protein